jgi:hypothetical protein
MTAILAPVGLLIVSNAFPCQVFAVAVFAVHTCSLVYYSIPSPIYSLWYIYRIPKTYIVKELRGFDRNVWHGDVIHDIILPTRTYKQINIMVRDGK